jgi:hypothetical protein
MNTPEDFSGHDILGNEKDRIKRLANLYKAAALHNVNGCDVVITFKHKGLESCVKTSVIAAGSSSVLCADGYRIAVKSIKQVEFL